MIFKAFKNQTFRNKHLQDKSGGGWLLEGCKILHSFSWVEDNCNKCTEIAREINLKIYFLIYLEEMFLYLVDLLICRYSGGVVCLFKIPRNATRQHDEGRITGNCYSTIRHWIRPCYGTSSRLPGEWIGTNMDQSN